MYSSQSFRTECISVTWLKHRKRSTERIKPTLYSHKEPLYFTGYDMSCAAH